MFESVLHSTYPRAGFAQGLKLQGFDKIRELNLNIWS